MHYANCFFSVEIIMKSLTLRTLFGSLVLASLTACGGSAETLPLEVAAAPALSTAAPQPSAMPVASACNDPACIGGVDGLADQFRTASMERAALAHETSEPGYPNVPAHALTVAEARAPEALGTAMLQRAQ